MIVDEEADGIGMANAVDVVAVVDNEGADAVDGINGFGRVDSSSSLSSNNDRSMSSSTFNFDIFVSRSSFSASMQQTETCGNDKTSAALFQNKSSKYFDK